MPGEPRQVSQIVATNLDQRLRLDHHIDQAAVIKFEQIAGAQEDRFGKHQADRGAFHASQVGGLHAALIGGNNHTVDRRPIAAIPRKDTDNAPH